jgi:hypothetical protein
MIQEPEEAKRAISKCYDEIIKECRLILASELHYQAMIYHHLRHSGMVPFNQIGMNVKTTITEVQNDFFHQRILLKNENYQSSGLEIIPDITFFSEKINYDWRRRNFENTFKETIYSLEIKASERHKSRLRQLEIKTDIQKLVAQRQETQKLFGKKIGVGVFVVDVAPDSNERMKEPTLNYIIEFAKLNEVDLWYFNQDLRIEALA